MNIVNVNVKTQNQSPSGLALFAQGIATALQQNGNFPNLYPKLSTLQDAIKAVNDAIAASRPGDKLSTVTLHAAVARLKRTLKALAAHVEYESNNDQELALSSGFQLRRMVQRSPQGFEVDYGEHSGSVELKCPREKNASYIWEYTPDPIDNSAWAIAGNSVNTRFTIKGLKPGTNYWFRVSTVNKGGQHPPCDPIMVMVI